MKRNKYINSFNTTAEYDNYIDSAAPGFPNVALTKDDGHVHYMKTSPNDYVIYGELVDNYNGNAPTFRFNADQSLRFTSHVDTLTNTFYLDAADITLVPQNITSLSGFCYDNKTQIKTVKKIKLNTSSVTNITQIFNNCSNLSSLNLCGLDFGNVTTSLYEPFRGSPIVDVYIDNENTLNKLTNNLSSTGNNYIPSTATIHYNGVDYKWQNNAWTAQS